MRAAKRIFAMLAMLLCIVSLCACNLSGSPLKGDEGFDNEDIGVVLENSFLRRHQHEAEEIVAKMSLEDKVAQLFIVSPEALLGSGTVTSAGSSVESAFGKRPVGGVLFKGPNLKSSGQTRDMLAGFDKCSSGKLGVSLFMCVDEEGGTVARVASSSGFGVKNVGNMCDIGKSGSEKKASEAASYIAGYLKDLGFNVDFAPDADIANVEGSELRYRSFGSSADAVTPMVEAQVKAFMDGGVLCCVKHFPGIGGAKGDTHKGSVYSNKTLDEIIDEEMKPFESAVRSGVPFVMVGHISLPEAIGDETPACMSKLIVTEQLRDRIGFQGVIITDSLGMGAVTKKYKDSEVGVAALEAGNDMILTPADFDSCYQGILDAVASGRLSEERIDESVVRILEVKLAYLSH